MDIPSRCRTCVHWLGHTSGRDTDPRCNRNWGHEPALGHFYSAEFVGTTPYQNPAFVTPTCRVIDSDGPLVPALDDWGNAVGPPAPPRWVDAYLPLLGREGDGDQRSVPVQFRTPYGTATFTSQDLHDYLMAATPAQKRKLLQQAKNRSGDRVDMQKRHAKHYTKEYGTTPQVLTGRGSIPPYQRGLERVPTGLAPLDIALKGGIPVGCRLNISGVPDSGKSTLVNRIEGSFIRYYVEHTKAYYESLVDGEEFTEEDAYEQVLGERIGLIKPENFELNYMIRAMGLEGFQGLSAEDVFDRHCDILATNFAEESTQYIISALNADNARLSEFRDGDTYSYMLPNQYRLFTLDSVDAEELAAESFGKNNAESMIGQDHRIAAQARLLAEFFRKGYKAAKIPVTLLLVSQQRTALTFRGARTNSHRGKAHPYFTTLEMNLYAKTMKDSDVTMEVVVTFGKVHVDAAIKSKDEISLYLRPGVGFTKIDNAVPVAFDLGLLKKSGSWVTYITASGEELRTQGTDPGKVADWLEAEGYVDELYDRTMTAAGLPGGVAPDAKEVDLIGLVGEEEEEQAEVQEEQVSETRPLNDLGLPRL